MTDHVPMHADEVSVDHALVAGLVAEQFPDLAGPPIRVVRPWGTDNAVWRLGDDHVIRLPRIESAVEQVERDHRWLPVLAPHLPTPIPEPVAIGGPGGDYPYPWAIHRWLPGRPAAPELIDDGPGFATDLVAVMRGLASSPTDGAPPARNRARPLADYDRFTRAGIESCAGLIDTAAAEAVWEEALAAAPYEGPPTWVHGDLEGNCLVGGTGRLCGLVDWGSMCLGDPAVDVQVVWSPLFTERSRRTLLEAFEVDDDTVARSRGAAIHQACWALSYYLHTYPLIVERSRHKLQAMGVPLR